MESAAGEAQSTALGLGTRTRNGSHLLDQFDLYLRSAYSKGAYRNCRQGLAKYTEYLSLTGGEISPYTADEFLRSPQMLAAPPSLQRQTRVILGRLVDAADGRLDLVALTEQSRRHQAEFEQKMAKAKESELVANQRQEQQGSTPLEKQTPTPPKENDMNIGSDAQVQYDSSGGGNGSGTGTVTFMPEGVPVDMAEGSGGAGTNFGETDAGVGVGVDTAELVPPAATQFKPSTAQPRVSHRPNLPEIKRVLNEEPRIKIYAVDGNGNQDEAGKYTVKEIKFSGGEAEFVRKFVQPRYPHCTVYRIVTIDAKDGEKLQGTVNVGKAQQPRQSSANESFRETVETIRTEQDRAANAERARLIEAEERQSRLLKSMKDFLGDSGSSGGSGGGNPLARDMIAMEMVKDVIQSIRGTGRDENKYIESLIRKLDERRDMPQEKPRTLVEQMMEYRLTKQMMDETFPQATYLPPMHPGAGMGPGGFAGFDGMGMGMGLPPMPALPPVTSPMKEVESALAVIQKISPPQQPVTYEGMLGMMNQVAQFVRPQQGVLDPNVAALLRKVEDLERRIADNANKPPTFVEQMQGFATAITAIQSIGQRLNPQQAQGARSSDMGMLEFIDSMAEKVPRIIDSVAVAKAKAAGFGGVDTDDDAESEDTDDSDQESENQNQKPKPTVNQTARRKQARIWAKFGEMIENSTDEDSTGNALVFLVNGIKDDPKWGKLFKGIAGLAVQRKRMQLRKVIATIINTMYKNNPPEGAIDRIVTVLVKHRTMFAKFVGIDPAKVQTPKGQSQQTQRAQSAPAPRPNAVPDMRTPEQIAAARAPATQATQGTRAPLRIVGAPVAPGVVLDDDEYPEIPRDNTTIDPNSASIIEAEASVLDGTEANEQIGDDAGDSDGTDEGDALDTDNQDMVSADGDSDEFDSTGDDLDTDEALGASND